MNPKTSPTSAEPTCAAQHFGAWMADPQWLADTVAAYNAGTLRPQAQAPEQPATMRSGNIAVVPISGMMVKGDSSLGGTSTVRTRHAIRQAAADPDVRGIMLHVDSPGGTVNGAFELADDIKAAASKKPLHSYIADTGASAGYLVASQARRISANRTAMVGSLGTAVRLVDTSGAAEKAGIKVHVVSTGPHKGAGQDGSTITDAHLKDVQEKIDDLNEHFIAAVKRGRNFDERKARELFDGRVHIADKAKAIGLIDSVESFDEAMARLNQEVQSMDSAQFTAHAAAHPDELQAAASGLVDAANRESHAAGVKEERERVAGIAGATTDAKLIRESIASGVPIAQVKDAVLAAQAQRITDLEQAIVKAQAAKTGQQPLSVGVESTIGTPIDTDDPEAKAEAEWNSGKPAFKARNKERYMSVRVPELAGQITFAN